MAQTEHYQLPLRESYDRPTHTGFNENQQRLDQILESLNTAIQEKQTNLNNAVSTLNTAIAQKADQSSVTSLEQRPDAIFGTYTGNGTSSRNIHLGFRPKAVLLECASGQRFVSGSGTFGGLAISGYRMESNSGSVIFEVTNSGFYVYFSSGTSFTNYSGMRYHYIAFK